MRHLIQTFLAICALALPAAAQGLFDPAARVDDAIITEYEVQQRMRFLQVLNAPGASREAALEALIDDRLRLRAASTVGLSITEEGLAEGLSDFAARGNLSTEDFVASLERAGIARETFRDFVQVNIVWRDLIRARYGNRLEHPRAAERNHHARPRAARSRSDGARRRDQPNPLGGAILQLCQTLFCDSLARTRRAPALDASGEPPAAIAPAFAEPQHR